ncbi:hypothetical protein CCP4SC76_3180001 [Gammaproteobacteria bacterium]
MSAQLGSGTSHAYTMECESLTTAIKQLDYRQPMLDYCSPWFFVLVSIA